MLLQELNDDIWLPYQRAYHARDTGAFLAVHAQELIRAGGPAKQIQAFPAYAAEISDWFAHVAALGDTLDIAFRFVERIVAGDMATEHGYYQLTARRANGERKLLYGRFHTFARRIDGRWRIVTDYDSTDGTTVTGDVFASAAAPDDTARFTGQRPGFRASGGSAVAT